MCLFFLLLINQPTNGTRSSMHWTIILWVTFSLSRLPDAEPFESLQGLPYWDMFGQDLVLQIVRGLMIHGDRLIYSDSILFFFMIYCDLLCFTVIYCDIPWYSIFYNILLWFTLIHYDLLWFTMIYCDLSWFTMIYYDSLWFTMNYYNLLWFTNQV